MTSFADRLEKALTAMGDQPVPYYPVGGTDPRVAEALADLWVNAPALLALVRAATYLRAEQESGDVHLDSAEALWQDLCAALDRLNGKEG